MIRLNIAPHKLPIAVLGLALALLAPAVAHADEPAAIALAPLETLGSESRVSKQTTVLVAGGLAEVAGYQRVAGKRVRQALRKNPRLKACAGKPRCLAKLGRAVDARYVVFGEVGGLGTAEVVYLQLIDVQSEKSVRSTTLELSGAPDTKAAPDTEATDARAAAKAAAYRLLAPERYVGRLVSEVDTPDAAIYVDGQRLGKSPSPPIPLPVGSHAVRITHPEFRDYVRFVDIEFDRDTKIQASLQQYPIVASDLSEDPSLVGSDVLYRGRQPTPWYRTWYGVAGVGGAAFIGGAILVGILTNGLDVDDERIIDSPR